MHEVKRLESFEEENARPKKLLAEAMLDKESLQVALGRKVLTTDHKREAVKFSCEATDLSQRVPAGLQIYLYRPDATRLSVLRLMRIYQGASPNYHWSASILATAASRREGLHVNHKRV
ncbi:hypothetical protein ACUXKK_004951 [Klebsiella aerogenes]|nr:hypothetical protein P851_01682 [Klebsiella aerogenes UCI 48]EUL48948.1 hypothetical protein P850_01685 [Klebsiella aerogenes UCI 47]EUL53898.1 hypothetical protein P849_01336 [Klebsiella aerogenes UCI 46]EUM03363.1 hypothetical protein P819_00991 [Klebsiella aerogenes UCI 16]EUM03506.1 hypothetical protein P817_00960 [Klebsiella aerogenes UCI 15]KDF34238.1 hypothetical protein AE03_01041 [Klebsiella aerogenes MGH 77]KDF35029.1 hypothetical protein AE04_01021 [Klebsiella aerogenes MGH 78]